MDIKVKWFYRLGFLLLLFVVIFIFLKLEPFWGPLLHTLIATASPFLIAAFIAYLLHPLVEKLHKNGLQKWLAVLIIYILFFGSVGYGLYKGIPIFIQQLKELSENIPNAMDQFENWELFIEEKTESWPDGVQEQIHSGFEAVNVGVEKFVEKVLNVLLWIVDKFFLIFLIPFIAFYMIKDVDSILNAFWTFIPRKWRRPARILVESIDQSLGNYIRGQLTVCGLIGSAAALFFWLVKMKYPLLLGSIVGATNVIPYFGPFIGAIPAVIVAATLSNKMIIYVIIIIFTLQFLEGNILSPMIVGKSLQMHPLVIMFAILVGGEVGGLMGLILAVPILAIIRTIVIQVRAIMRNKEHYQESQEINRIEPQKDV